MNSKINFTMIDTVGDTPIVELWSLRQELGLEAHIYAKLEMFNPTGSIKYRVAKKIIEDAVERGELARGGTVIEPTSGNTGIALASICACRSLKMIAVMPSNMSRERIALIRAYGGSVELTPAALGMKGAVERAERIHQITPNSIIAGQFENSANPLSHFETTGPEIADAFLKANAPLDAIVCGIGTGGTITGVGRYLKTHESNNISHLMVYGVEPVSSPFLTQGVSGPHKIQGIGAGFKPAVLDTSLIDGIIPVTDEEAFEYSQIVARTDGIFCGISSGAALAGAVKAALAHYKKGGNIVAVFPDGGEKYISVPGFVK